MPITKTDRAKQVFKVFPDPNPHHLRYPECFIGIDPGLKGGMAVIDACGVRTIRMPTTERDIWGWLRDLGRFQRGYALIERVQAMPGNGVSSMFKFGWGYGGLRMGLIAAEVTWEEVEPKTWQKEIGVSRRKGEKDAAWKNRLRAKAQQLFPKDGAEINLATADALLIALVCRRRHGTSTWTDPRKTVEIPPG
jgi:crossover junction endodeoxyribonuclease RuvC